MMKILADAFPIAHQIVYEAKPITSFVVTGTTFDAVPAHCAAALDVTFFALPPQHATKAISGIFACTTAGAAATIHLFGPESMGGVGDIGARIDADTARTGLSDDEFGPKMFDHTERKLVQWPFWLSCNILLRIFPAEASL